MGGHPIENHPDAALMEQVNQEHQILGRAVAARRRIVTGRLVTPRAVKGMLHEGKELDMGEAHPLDVVGELGRQFAVGQPAIALLRHAHPGADVDFVNGNGAGQLLAQAARGHPLAVGPLVVEVPNHRGGFGRGFLPNAAGVGLVHSVAVLLGADVILVEGAWAQLRDETRPDAGLADGLQRMLRLAPIIEIAHDEHLLGVRRPHGKVRAAFTVVPGQVRAEFAIDSTVRAFAKAMQVVRGEPIGFG